MAYLILIKPEVYAWKSEKDNYGKSSIDSVRDLINEILPKLQHFVENHGKHMKKGYCYHLEFKNFGGTEVYKNGTGIYNSMLMFSDGLKVFDKKMIFIDEELKTDLNTVLHFKKVSKDYYEFIYEEGDCA